MQIESDLKGLFSGVLKKERVGPLYDIILFLLPKLRWLKTIKRRIETSSCLVANDPIEQKLNLRLLNEV